MRKLSYDGFRENLGLASPELTPYLKGNQCENCHGPGSAHAQSPDDKSLREFLSSAVKNADSNRLCLKCHDEDNSPHFDFSTYYGKIIHKGKDAYNDPRVHKGLSLEDLKPR